MSKVVQASDLRNNLADVLNSIGRDVKYLMISRNHEVNAVIVDIDFFEELLALMSKDYLKSIREARKEYKKGQTSTHEDVFGKL